MFKQKFIVHLVTLLTFSFPLAQALANSNSPIKQQSEKNFGYLPSLKDHHQSIDESLKQKINANALELYNKTEEALYKLSREPEKDISPLLEEALKMAESVSATDRTQQNFAIDYRIEISNYAPNDLKAIKLLRRDLNKAYYNENFPEVRTIMAAMESELHMQLFSIPVTEYRNVLKETLGLLKDQNKSLAESKLRILNGHFTVQDWSVPLPLIEAEMAILDAQTLKSINLEKAQEKINLADHQLDRADALGYVVGEKEAFKRLKKQLKTVKDEIRSRKNIDFPSIDRFRHELLSMIKKFSPPTVKK